VEPLAARLVSRNEHKLRELRRALPGWELDLIEAGELPPEVGETYYENALAKARFGRETGDEAAWMLGEDSGIEVAGLGGAPGLRSARWAGGEHVARVLEALEGVEGEGRRARYVCELVALSPFGEEVRGTGVLEGAIAEQPRGSAGFGFDPVFVPRGEERTVAELGDEWKAEHSHRARAARALGLAVTAPEPGFARREAEDREGNVCSTERASDS
jgi:XTP/dITP diphosphohydrolase